MSLRWGILGAGNISGQFVHDLVLSNQNGCEKHIIASVGCSSTDKGQEFLHQHKVVAENNQGVTPLAQTYQAFFENPNVDIVYIGTPHVFHKEQVLQALKHGKHVLCEKPFTVTGAQTKEVLQEAEAKDLFVMEAVWTRFFPLVHKARQLLFKEKIIGDVHRLNADFSMAADVYDLPASSRARDIKLGAGATLDIGIYPLTYMRALFSKGANESFEVKSFLSIDPIDGVDHVATYIVQCEDGRQAVLTSSNHVDGPSPFLRVEGKEGTLEMYAENPAQPRKLRVVFKDKRTPIEIDEDIVTSGYNGFIYEADAVVSAIKAGKKQCDVMPWTETQLMMDTMDKIRHENDFFYDIE